jgi:hydroxymethylbilane synthase
MDKVIRIGTRESQLAVWQATLVQKELSKNGHQSELIYIKSDGDIDLHTPIYEFGVQGVFTKSLDIAVLNNTIDIAVHSMKDVPIQLAKGIIQSAVLKRASYKDILVFKDPSIVAEWKLSNPSSISPLQTPGIIATSSIRRKAQWLHRYPNHTIEILRGNVNTRLNKVEQSNWNGAIFAAAGLERIELRPENSIDLNWMLPAPAQGAIMVVCREDDSTIINACKALNDNETVLCTKIERDFLKTLLGGCSTPISALAQVIEGHIYFNGNVLSTDGKEKIEIEKNIPLKEISNWGVILANEILKKGADKIINAFEDGK